MNTVRDDTTPTLLPNGQVLVAGGFVSKTSPVLASAELFTPPPTPTPTPIQGTYQGTGTETATGKSHSFRMLIQQSGVNLTGALSWDFGPVSLLSGTFTTSTAFHLRVSQSNGALLLTGQITATSATLSGTFTLPNGTIGTWTALLAG